MKLRVAQVIADTEAEGPGRRYALWVQGCSLRCPGCCNPEMFAPDRGGALREVEAVLAEVLARRSEVEGISVLGGEPFEQPLALAELCAGVRAAGLSVMVYTGYRLEELHAKPEAARLLANVDLLVDGRYEASQPEHRRRWIGSTNQVLHFLSSRYSPTDPRFSSGNTIELRLDARGVTVNGWPSSSNAFWRSSKHR